MKSSRTKETVNFGSRPDYTTGSEGAMALDGAMDPKFLATLVRHNSSGSVSPASDDYKSDSNSENGDQKKKYSNDIQPTNFLQCTLSNCEDEIIIENLAKDTLSFLEQKSDNISFSSLAYPSTSSLKQLTKMSKPEQPACDKDMKNNAIPFSSPNCSDTEEPILHTVVESVAVGSMDYDSISIPQKTSRKRIAKPENWRYNKAKTLRNLGKAYLTNSRTNRRVIPERQLKSPCSSKCKLKCFEKITEGQRKTIFKEYWAIGDLQRQREFILQHLSTIKPKYSYKVHNSNRGNNRGFYFTVNQERIRVCKVFFKATLDISDRAIKTVVQKTIESCGIISSDNRGKHKNHKSLDPKIKEGVRKHINSIPRIESHYYCCDADSKREYIHGGVTIADLHKEYSNELKEEGAPYANYLMYNHIFKNEFNISFFQPKKVQCDDCASFANISEEEKSTLQQTYESYMAEKLSREHERLITLD